MKSTPVEHTNRETEAPQRFSLRNPLIADAAVITGAVALLATIGDVHALTGDFTIINFHRRVIG